MKVEMDRLRVQHRARLWEQNSSVAAS